MFELQRVTLKQFYLVPWSPLQLAGKIWLSNPWHILVRSLPTSGPAIKLNIFLCLVVLFGFFLTVDFDLERVIWK